MPGRDGRDGRNGRDGRDGFGGGAGFHTGPTGPAGSGASFEILSASGTQVVDFVDGALLVRPLTGSENIAVDIADAFVAFSLTGPQPHDWKPQFGVPTRPGAQVLESLSGGAYSFRVLTGSTNGSVVEADDAVVFSLTGPAPADWKPSFGVPTRPGAQVLESSGGDAYSFRVLTGSTNIAVEEADDAVTFSLTGPAPADWKPSFGVSTRPGAQVLESVGGDAYSFRVLTGSINIGVVETGEAVAFSLTGPVPDSWKPAFAVPTQPGAQLLEATTDNSYLVCVLTGSTNIGVTEVGDAVRIALTDSISLTGTISVVGPGGGGTIRTAPSATGGESSIGWYRNPNRAGSLAGDQFVVGHNSWGCGAGNWALGTLERSVYEGGHRRLEDLQLPHQCQSADGTGRS
jgi:hypothetical protein